MRRTCVGCRKVVAPDELVRVVRTREGTLRVGRALPGRGAWIHAGCVAATVGRNAFARAFRAPVSAAAVAELSEAIASVCENRGLPDTKGLA